ncbi:MAG: hypothetical protein NTY47_08865, partial [Candidatus Omnitrophica bacterium]|nr:hypothetical protein [Candidatus Omnitrophota bacterium]
MHKIIACAKIILFLLIPVLVFALDDTRVVSSGGSAAPVAPAPANPQDITLAQNSTAAPQSPTLPLVPGAPVSGGIMPGQNAPAPEPQASAEAQNVTAAAEEPSAPLSAEELNKGVKVDRERLSLDLKGIDINELLRIISVKMGITIAPTKSVSGRVNIFLNNLTFSDALDVILISQDLAMDRSENIINIMTSSEYERLYGKKYNEKRKMITYKLTYAKPATVLAALSQVKSDIGRVVIDEATGTVLLIDIPEKLEVLEKTIRDLDAP